MYRFDCSLIGRLPGLMKKTIGEVAEMIGTNRQAFAKWTSGDIPCEALVRVCNTFRISLIHFIKVGSASSAKGVISDYVIPEGVWVPVEWHSEAAAKLFGPGGLTGIGKQEAVDRLGLSARNTFDRWALHPSSPRMEKLIQLLNEFQVDASLFFKDSNIPLPVPVWVSNNHIATIMAERLESYKDLERKNMEKDGIIRSLNAEVERLRRENRALRLKEVKDPASSPRLGIFAESSAGYKSLLKERGYAFHSLLWEALPAMFEMTVSDFCSGIGLDRTSFYNQQNVHVDILIKACNLLRISATHFFVPKNEPLVVHERTYYQISSRIFVPIEGRMERMKFLFGRYSATGFTRDELHRHAGVGQDAFKAISEGIGEKFRVITLADICTKFNIPPYVFFEDGNRKKPVFSQTLNERLILNSVEMGRELEVLRKKKNKKTGEVDC